MKDKNIQAYAKNVSYSDKIDILICSETHIAESLVMKEDPGQGSYNDPTLTLSWDNAQKLMNSLWMCGLRPMNKEDFQGELKATQNHLEDMRSLVFSTPIIKPKT